MNGHTNGDAPSPLPSAKSFQVSSDLVIQPPLTRRGHGPGLVLLVPHGIDLSISTANIDPPPLLKWAEEGFAVAQITLNDDSQAGVLQDQLQAALGALSKLETCNSIEKIGVISYNAPISSEMSKVLDATNSVVAIVTYGSRTFSTDKPQLRHITGAVSKNATSDGPKITKYEYPDAAPNFVIPTHEDFQNSKAAVSHTRCLTFLKPLTGGPYFDIEAIWDEHTLFEFGERHVEKTMGTMVQEPYVNHVPTLTGGIGRDKLTHFYRHHFIFNNPADTDLELISRTVGIDRVIDEFNFRFTHDKIIDWLLPGVPPTGKYVEIPFTSVVNVRGDRLFHEHINWDQATALYQLGLLPDYLPFPYPLPDGRKPAAGKRFEYRVPTTGIETATKLRDECAIESNGMFEFDIREVDIN